MRKEDVVTIIQYFEELFPDAHCELNHQNEFELLIAVMLSAQTTDQSVNKLTDTLFKKYLSVDDFASAPIEQLEKDLRSIGLYRNKAKNVKQMAMIIRDEYAGVVPREHELLVALPGVGRKTANVVQSVAFDIPAFAVDTHVERIAKRLKFAKNDDSVLMVEKKVTKVLPIETWNKAHHQFIFFGRYFCKAQNPNCGDCQIIHLCRKKNWK